VIIHVGPPSADTGSPTLGRARERLPATGRRPPWVPSCPWRSCAAEPGVFGVDGSAPIINHPEAAILGIGRIIDKPWVVGGELAVRKVTQLSLTFDHRVCDGGVARGFLRHVADCVEQPAVLVADL
jgi:hypothetical protein